MQDELTEFRVRLHETLESLGFPLELASNIEGRLICVTYQKGAIIFTRGSPADLLFLLLKGFVKLYLLHDRGRTLVDLKRPGELLNFATEADSKGRRQLFEAHALTKCSIGLLAINHLQQVLSPIDQRTTVSLLENLNTAWSRMFERLVTFAAYPFQKRLQVVIENLAARFGVNEKRGILLVPELSHEDLAEMIGSSRPMVSKLIGEMLRNGILVRGQGRRLILRVPAQRSSLASSEQPRLAAQGNEAGNAEHSPGMRMPLSPVATSASFRTAHSRLTDRSSLGRYSPRV